MKKALISAILVVSVVSALILPASCGQQAPPAQAPPAQTPKPSATLPEIRVGILGAATGPTSAATMPMIQEMESIFRYMNEFEGGLDGAKVGWRSADTKGTPDGAVIAYKELRDSLKPLIYFAIEDYLYSGIKDMINEDKAIFLTAAALDSKLYVPPGRFFSCAIATADGFGGYGRWVKDSWKGTGLPKVGVLYWDRPSGLQWKPAEAWVKNLGIELMPVSYPIASMDLKPQLLSLRDAKVNYIWMLGIANNLSLAIRDFRALDLHGKIPFTFNEYSDGQVVLAIAGAAAEGFYDYRAESPYSDGSEAARYYSKVWKWAKNEDKWSENRISVTVQATIRAAVKQAVADVGWNKLNNEAIYTALTKLTNIDTGGNMKDFGYGQDKRVGVSTIKIRKFTATSPVSASDWIKLPRIFEGIDK